MLYQVSINTSHVAATENLDYVHVSSTLIFQDGSQNNTMICINIIIIDDLRIEGEEIFYMTLFSTDLDVFFSTNTTIIVIMDDEGINDNKSTFLKPLCYILAAPRVSIHPTDTNVTKFQAFSLICEGTGNPIPEILWAHNGSIIVPDQEHVSVLSTALQRAYSTLTISMADINTSGLYYCTVSAAGETERSTSAVVFVQSEPCNLPSFCAHYKSHIM